MQSKEVAASIDGGGDDLVPFGPPGQWTLFQQSLAPVDRSSATAVLRHLVGFVLGNEDCPHMLTAYYDNAEDDTPKYRVIAFDVPYQAYLHFMETAQPSWFTVKAEKKPSGFNLRLTPTRSLMKLVYKEVKE